MPYKTKDKTTVHIRLSHFLYNGLDVASSKLDMSMSEVVRMAIYEWLKTNFTKKELDYFAERDDVVDELIDHYRNKGRAGSIEVGSDDPHENMDYLTDKSLEILKALKEEAK